MKLETIAIHAGYDGDPTTKAVAVPIYQTVAFEFDSAEHGAALFNLEVKGNIYTRIGNPTNAVLEQRMAAMEGGVDGLAHGRGVGVRRARRFHRRALRTNRCGGVVCQQ